VDVVASLQAPVTPDLLFPWIDDLGRYPDWLDIVPRAVPVEAHADDIGPAWLVDLRGKVGPFARAKRLRMVRTEREVGDHVRFERAEHDGRQHSPWVLDAELLPEGDGTLLTMRLHYGGRLWMPVLDRLLADEVERSRPRLLARVAGA
jgi:hypothetical protein